MLAPLLLICIDTIVASYSTGLFEKFLAKFTRYLTRTRDELEINKEIVV